jgi:hypothetical protein
VGGSAVTQVTRSRPLVGFAFHEISPSHQLFSSALLISSSRQLFFAAFPLAFANGLGALPALIAAQRFFAAAAIALRAAALIPRFRFTAGLAGVGVALAALIPAQRFRAASAIAFRPAALRVRLRATGEDAATGVAAAFFPARLPLCFAGPCRA